MHVHRRTIATAAALISGITLAAAPIATDVADAAAKKIYCNATIANTTIRGDVIVDGTNCVLQNVRVTGNVVAADASGVRIESYSRIRGNVSSSSQSYVQIVNSRVDGTLSAVSGFATISESRIRGDATIFGTYRAEIADSHFGSNLEVARNKEAEVIKTAVDGKLSGKNNVTVREKNRARGGATGHFGGPDGAYFWDDCPGNNCDDS